MAPRVVARTSEAFASKAYEPAAGTVGSVFMSMLAMTVLSACLAQRYLAVKNWRRLAFIPWLVFAIYADSWCFIFSSTVILHGFGVASTYETCSAAIFVCLVCYLSSKIVSSIPSSSYVPFILTAPQLVYLFLVERAFVIHGNRKSRLQSKLYIFNSFGMLSVYIIIAIINFVFRIAEWSQDNCVIGMRYASMIPMIFYDFAVNLYLTVLFIIPLPRFFWRAGPQPDSTLALKAAARRAFVGACCTTVSSVTNLTILMALRGEKAWICLTCCNADIAFTAIVIQWITSKDCGKTRQVGARPPGRTRTTPLPGGEAQPSLPPAPVRAPYDSRPMVEVLDGLPVVSALGTFGGNAHEAVCSHDMPREARERRRTDLDGHPSDETLPNEPGTPSTSPDWDKE